MQRDNNGVVIMYCRWTDSCKIWYLSYLCCD